MRPLPANVRTQRRFMLGMGVLDGILAAVSFGIGFEMSGWVFTTAAAISLLVGMFWGSRSQLEDSVPSSQDVSTPTLTPLKPIMKLREEIGRLLVQNEQNPVVKVMALDTQTEVDAIAVRSVEILESRRKVAKLAEGMYKTRTAVARLTEQSRAEQDPAVKDSLLKSVDARKQELEVYDELQAVTKKLDANLVEAEATLAELKSQIIRAAADSAQDSANEEMDPFNSLTERMRQLSKTMDESIETVRANSWV